MKECLIDTVSLVIFLISTTFSNNSSSQISHLNGWKRITTISGAQDLVLTHQNTTSNVQDELLTNQNTFYDVQDHQNTTSNVLDEVLANLNTNKISSSTTQDEVLTNQNTL